MWNRSQAILSWFAKSPTFDNKSRIGSRIIAIWVEEFSNGGYKIRQIFA